MLTMKDPEPVECEMREGKALFPPFLPKTDVWE